MSALADGNEYKSAKLFQATVMPMAKRITFLKPNEEVVSGIRAMNAYGHTPGHLAFHIESNGRSCARAETAINTLTCVRWAHPHGTTPDPG